MTDNKRYVDTQLVRENQKETISEVYTNYVTTKISVTPSSQIKTS